MRCAATITANSVLARSRVTPGLSRPIMVTHLLPRCVSRDSPFSEKADAIIVGTQISVAQPLIIPLNQAGATPTTVIG